MNLALILIAAYLLGAIPTAFVISLFLKKGDIRKLGSGNVGGMNVYRTAGLLPGLFTVLIDIGKGALAVLLLTTVSTDPALLGAAAFLAVLGHNYNLFLAFNGGKGLATACGAFLAFSPQVPLFVIPAAVLLALVLKDTNTAFGAAMILIPLTVWLLHGHFLLMLFGLGIAVAIIIKHVPDFKAYRQGRRKLLRS